MDNKYILCFIFLIIGLFLGSQTKDEYIIISSNKTQCDILLNKSNGDTWFNQNGYWEKVSKDIVNVK